MHRKTGQSFPYYSMRDIRLKAEINMLDTLNLYIIPCVTT